MQKLLLLLFLGLGALTLTAQEEEYGLASYFSDDFHGRSTAYGDTYDKNEMTCAHKRYPYGSMVRVTRLDNRRSVVVKVIDKGPFIRGRVVDLSRRAAETLGIIDEGAVEVKVTLVNAADEGLAAEDDTPPARPEPNRPVTGATVEEVPDLYSDTTDPPAPETTTPRETPPTEAPREENTERRPNTTSETTRPANNRYRRVGQDFNPYGLYRIALEKPVTANFGVQVGSYMSFDNVLKRIAELQTQWFDNVMVSIEAGSNNNAQYKIILGPFDTQEAAQNYQSSLRSRYNIQGFVVDLRASEE